jgi:hypothetical protein
MCLIKQRGSYALTCNTVYITIVDTRRMRKEQNLFLENLSVPLNRLTNSGHSSMWLLSSPSSKTTRDICVLFNGAVSVRLYGVEWLDDGEKRNGIWRKGLGETT